MAEYGFVFNATRCTGCKTCVLACKDTKDLPYDVSFRQVYEYEGSASAASGAVGAGPSPVSAQAWTCDENGAWRVDAYVYYVSLACNHCADPVCMHVCPTGAMHRNSLGFVVVDEHRCVMPLPCAAPRPKTGAQRQVRRLHGPRDARADARLRGRVPPACLGLWKSRRAARTLWDGRLVRPVARPRLHRAVPHRRSPA